jgi:hypothetical protein
MSGLNLKPLSPQVKLNHIANLGFIIYHQDTLPGCHLLFASFRPGFIEPYYTPNPKASQPQKLMDVSRILGVPIEIRTSKYR